MTQPRQIPTIILCAALLLGAAVAIGATSYSTYTVRSGDTVTRIASLHGIEPVVIIVHNNLKEPYRLSIGQRLKIPKPQSSRTVATKHAPTRKSTPTKSLPPPTRSSSVSSYTVKKGDTLASIARRHGSSIEILAAINSLKNPSSIYPGQELIISGSASAVSSDASGKVSKGGGEKRSTSSSYSGPRNFQWPVRGRIIKTFSPNGYIKSWGIMIAASEGTSVKASRSGQVTFSGNSIPGYGNMIMIDHGDDYYSVYAHNKSNLVGVSKHVRQGDQIALVGKRPQDPEHNLYFEIRNNKGEALDPERYLTK